MFIEATETFASANGNYLRRHIYDVEPATAAPWLTAGLAKQTTKPPPHVAELLAKLDDGAGKACVFLPFVGEFGHLIMSHIRLVHFHKASRKIVCCRPGEEVLF